MFWVLLTCFDHQKRMAFNFLRLKLMMAMEDLTIAIDNSNGR